MAATTEQPRFTLSEDITEADIPIMAAIGHESFLEDTHTNIKEYLLPKKGVDDSGIRDWLEARERCHVIKAVSTTTDEIMGYICWVHRGYVPRPPRAEATSGRFTEASSEVAPKTKIQVMEDMEDQHFTDFMTEIMPDGTKCWFVGGLTVAPKFHRMGVGRALLGWGTSRAEKDGVFAWVHSSDSAWQAYAACGFEVVRVLRTDLDAYAEGDAVAKGPGEGGKWGVYTVRYMAYKPERIGTNGWEVIKDVEATPLS
ncbi:putative GNAT family acetyltransferase [Xylariales sp. AK1849]|nr:putative GNAT family acetyltransferase [Xylariales sp. AK1849]